MCPSSSPDLVTHLYVAIFGAPDAVEDRRECATSRYHGRRSGRDFPSPPKAPASCRRRPHRNRALACRVSPASSATICEPSSCTSNQPFWKDGSACTLGCRPAPSIGAMRMPWWRVAVGHGAGILQLARKPFACCLQRVDAQVERRPAGERTRPRATQSSPNVCLKQRRGPIGAVGRDGPALARICDRRPLAVRLRTAAPARNGRRPARRSAIAASRPIRPAARRSRWRAAYRHRTASRPSACGAARHRRCCRSRRGRRRRQNDATGPNPSAHRPPGDAACSISSIISMAAASRPPSRMPVIPIPVCPHRRLASASSRKSGTAFEEARGPSRPVQPFKPSQASVRQRL